MKILVTGSKGFIAKNLITRLKEHPEFDVSTFNRSDKISDLEKKIKDSNLICHFAGVNRPVNQSEFKSDNTDLTQKIAEILEKIFSKSSEMTPIIFTSSTQAKMDNPYGLSKLDGENSLIELKKKYNYSAFIYRLPNVFGKWSKPNYNSAIATFCHNISRDMEITIDNPEHKMEILYVDDLVESILQIINLKEHKKGSSDLFHPLPNSYHVTVQETVDLIKKFHNDRKNLKVSDVGVGLERALYSTYISFLPADSFKYEIQNHSDNRGSFVEMLKTKTGGQFSFFTAKPGITRGGHYHHTKTEKFLVISGKAMFSFIDINTHKQIEIITCSDYPEVVDTIPGWAHDIKNIGSEDLIVMLWANEVFDPEIPDTYQYNME